MRSIHFTSAAALLLAAASAQAQLVSNGGFETGDFSGWTVTGGAFTGIDALSAQTGSFGAFFGEASPGSSIAQNLNTVTGGLYQVSFWLQLDDSAQPNSFSFSWNGVTQALSFNNAAAFDYTRFTAVVSAAGPVTALRFNLTNPQSFWLLDNVVVTAVPEPQAWALGALGLLMIAVRKARASTR